jgi:pilus assembly protein CpaB
MKPARIIVLVIALVAGGIAAILASRQGPAPAPVVAQFETTEVLIAKSDIGLGSTITAQELGWQVWPATAVGSKFIRKSSRPDAIKELTGWMARSGLTAGEPIVESKLINAQGSGYMAAVLPSGMRAISLEIVPETGASGFILPRDRVDVILTRKDKAAEKAAGVEVTTSETILTNVRVLAIGSYLEEKNEKSGGQRGVEGRQATLELTQRQAETLALGRQLGPITLALRSLADFEAGDEPIQKRPEVSENRSINVVRYGVTTKTEIRRSPFGTSAYEELGNQSAR